MEELLGQVSNIGFPIALSIYLLVRLEGKLERLSESIIELSKTINSMNNSPK
ncbi:YvrJ family protein [Fonticella tunisiensis]|uniref:YvrJ-like protein n=1 Tax=Fonticella tunisiensis TaxID=1096341 RepID=A0A4R7KS31_9CLOT|nr:YvrJ family protein [Fonticella tunisiensis]TDT62414.1 YvrJ-like protein [Fonticella tunisiensis]